MALSQAQAARNNVARLACIRASPAEIEQARAELDYAKASQAVTTWRSFTLMQRARLAAQLLADHDDAIAT
jgi:hypothetical protein